MANKCSHEDTRLTCSECGKPICSQCLVQCPVGFRCKTCVGITDTQRAAGAAKPAGAAKTFGMAAFVGFSGGWVMPFVRIPWVSCIICYFLGLFAGRWLAARINDRLNNLTKTIVYGLLLGMALTPCVFIGFAFLAPFLSIVTGHLDQVLGDLYGLVTAIYCPVCFMIGVLRPTVWGDRW